MRFITRSLALGVFLAGHAAGAADAAPPLTVKERIELAEAMQKCWKNDSVNVADTQLKGGGSLKGDVEGAMKKVASIAADARFTADFRKVVRSEFAAFSDSNAALVIRGCYKGLFGEELTPPAPAPAKSRQKKPAAPTAGAPAAQPPEQSARVEQTIDATAARVKAGTLKAVSDGGSTRQVIRGQRGAVIEMGDIVSETKGTPASK